MPRHFCAFILVFGVVFGLSRPLWAEEKYTVTIEKQETKAKQRWSIQDWLDTRDRMRLMDLWLAMHSPSPYEFYLGAAYKSAGLATGSEIHGFDFTFAAYAYLMGVELQYQTSNLDTRILGLVNFRIFGVYNQATNLTLQAGVKQITRSGVGYFNPLIGGHFTLYIVKSFGGELLYQYTLARAGGILTGTSRFQGGGFIDFKFVRVFCDYVTETESSNAAASFNGFQVGTRLYF